MLMLPPPLPSLWIDSSVNLLLSWALKNLHRSPINDRKTFHRPGIPSWGPEQPTVSHEPPGRQASLGLALTALLMRHRNQKMKRAFTNLSPLKSWAPVLSYDFTVKSLALQIFCLFWLQTQRVICCLHCEVGPAEMGVFWRLIQHWQSSPLTEYTIQVLNWNSFLIFHLKMPLDTRFQCPVPRYLLQNMKGAAGKKKSWARKDPEAVLHPQKSITSKLKSVNSTVPIT